MSKPVLELSSICKDKRSGNWSVFFWVKVGFEKTRQSQGGFKLKGTANDWFNRTRAEVEAGLIELDGSTGKPLEREVVTLDDLIERQKVASAGKRPRTRKVEELSFRKFAEFLGGERRINRIGGYDLERYLSTYYDRNCSAHTIRRELTQLRYLFNNAIRWGLIAKNPAEGIKKPRLAEGKVVYLDPREQGSLLKACQVISLEDQEHNSSNGAPYLFPLITLALRTGMRKSELLNLRWKNVDLKRRKVRVVSDEGWQTKSGRSRMLPLDDQCIDALQWWQNWFPAELSRCRLRMRDTSLHVQLQVKAEARLLILEATRPHQDRLVFPSFKAPGQPMGHINRSFDAALKKAFAVDDVLPEKYQIGLHALRHSFAVACAMNHVPIALLSKLLGHADIQTTMIYLRFYPDDAADALNLPAIQF